MGGTLQSLKESTRKCPIHQTIYDGICGEKDCYLGGLICLSCDPNACIVKLKHQKIGIDEFYDNFFKELTTAIDFKKFKDYIQSASKINQEEVKTQFSKYKDWELKILETKLTAFEKKISKKIFDFQIKIMSKLRDIDNDCKNAFNKIDVNTIEPLSNLRVEETTKFILDNVNNLKQLQNKLQTIKTYSNMETIKSKQKNYETIIYTKMISEPLSNIVLSEKTQSMKNKLDNSVSELMTQLFIEKETNAILSQYEKRFESNPTLLQANMELSSKAQKSYTIDSVFSVFTGNDDIPYLAIPISGSSNSYEIEIINLKNNKVVKKLTGHTQHIFTVRHFFQRKTGVHYLISTSLERKVKVWNLNNYTCQLTISNSHSGMYLYSALIIFDDIKGDNYIITSCPNEYMKMWDFYTGKFISDIGSTNDYTYFISPWINDKSVRIINANGSNVKIYNINEPKSLYKEYKPEQPTWHMCAFAEKLRGVWHLFESDGNGFLRIWKIESGELYKSIRAQNCNFRGLCFWSERFIIGASSDKGFKVLDIEEGICATSIIGHSNVVCTVQKIYHPSYGECLITSAIDGKIKLWSNPNNHKA